MRHEESPRWAQRPFTQTGRVRPRGSGDSPESPSKSVAQRAGALPRHPSKAQRVRSDLQGVHPGRPGPRKLPAPAVPGSDSGLRCQVGRTPGSGAHNRGAGHRGASQTGRVHSCWVPFCPPSAPPCPPYTVPIVCPRHLELPLWPQHLPCPPLPGGAHKPSALPGPQTQQAAEQPCIYLGTKLGSERAGGLSQVTQAKPKALGLNSFLPPKCRPPGSPAGQRQPAPWWARPCP